MIKKLVYIVGCYLTLVLAMSCNDDYGGCGDTQFDYVHTGISASTIVKKVHRKSEEILTYNNDSITLDEDNNVGFIGSFQDSMTKVTSLCSGYSSIVSQAYATPATLVVHVLQDTFVSLNIVTLNDFDSTHRANSDVTEYFTYGESRLYGSSDEPMDSILGFLNGYDDQWHAHGIFVLFILQETPTMDQELKFEIIATYTSGKSLSVTTKPVFLMP